MPAQDSVGRDDQDGPAPVRPQAQEQHPEHAIDATQPRAPRRLALEDGKLMPEGENLGPKLETGPSGGSDGGE